jgi:formamidopyrimidine-DNA glycosylase
MPELPEVETIKNQLNEVMPVKVKSIQTSDVVDSIAHTPLDGLSGNTIVEVQRKGKMLNFLLKDKQHLLCHLGMTGGWRITKKPCEEKHTHLAIEGKGVHLSYVDPRRFGHMYLYNEKDAEKKLAELGEDLKSPNFTEEYFIQALKKYPERHLKVTLLDQSLFAGTGNYIASEICARAKVRPQRRVKSLSKKELSLLYKAVFEVIDGATETGGTTFQGGYADTSGSKGGGVQHLVVFYQKTCQMCHNTPVKKITLAQRGTYYCPTCQK